MNCGAVFFATSSFACAQIGLQGTVVDEVGAVGPKSSIVVLRIPEVLQKAAPRSLRTPKFSSVRFDREIAVAQGRKDFVIPDAPDGKYRLCAVTDDPAYVGSCDFADPRDSYFDIKNGQVVARKLALTLRRGTIVEIIVDDPKGLIGDAGFHFRPSLMSSTGEYKVALVTGRSAGQIIYTATIPRDLFTRLVIDTRLRVTDASGETLKRLMPTSIIAQGGPARLQIRLGVAALDQDLSSRPRKTTP